MLILQQPLKGIELQESEEDKKEKHFNKWCLLTLDLTLSEPTPQNGQRHSNNLSAVANKLF